MDQPDEHGLGPVGFDYEFIGNYVLIHTDQCPFHIVK